MSNKTKKILIMGAGGAGVSNIAQIYKELGHEVIGVDKIKNAATENLERLGIPVFTEDEPNILNGVKMIFKSAAIKYSHPIIQEAKGKRIYIISRYELFEELSNDRDVIAIAGSSGKTSTTGITAHILSGDRDCGYLIGIHGNGGHNGTHQDFVLEADEYAKTFLHIKQAKIGLITGLKYDHVDIYKTKAEYDEAFVTFASRCKTLIINGDDQYLVDTIAQFKPVTFGKKDSNEWVAKNIQNFEGGSNFDVYHKGELVTAITLQVIGGHNIINALAGFVANYLNGVEVKTIVDQLSVFTGLPRRLEMLKSNPYYVYDDYAHLPFEIDTVLSGLRESFKDRRIICYFQGHTYTRINAFFDDYALALSKCDYLLLGDVYAARDAVGSVDLDKMLSMITCKNKVLSGTTDNTIELLKSILQDRDVLVCLNAGDGTKVAHYFKK
jgi:UDP-N-acetylmuramate--alanine ligase